MTDVETPNKASIELTLASYARQVSGYQGSASVRSNIGVGLAGHWVSIWTGMQIQPCRPIAHICSLLSQN
jgi:hypothetical protein